MKPSKPRGLTRYLDATRRHKALLLIPAIVLASASYLALKRVPDQFESTALIAVESKSQRLPLDERRLLAIQQRVAEDAFLRDLIAKHNLYAGEMENAPAADSITRARRDLKVTPKGGPDSAAFMISFRANEASLARSVTASLADYLVATSERPGPPRDSASTEPLQKRAMDLLGELSVLESKNPSLLEADSIPAGARPAAQPRAAQPSSDWVRAQQMTVESLKDQQYKIQQQLADVEQRVEAQRRLVERQKGGSDLSDNPTYAVLINRRAELQGQRDTLINRQELTDKHPRVAAIVDQINAIDRQVEELRTQGAGRAGQTAEARELASLQSERNRLKLELEINSREIARRTSSASPVAASPAHPPVTRPARASAPPAVARQYAALKRDYEEVMARIRESDSTANAPAGEGYRLIEAASLPSGPVSPGRLLIMAAAFGAGLFVGACFILAADRRRFKSLEDARDVEYYAGAPMLAAIPKSMTGDERKGANLRANVRLAFAMVLAAAATFALSELLASTDIIEIIAGL